MSEHDEIITEAREKYTVHNCDQCEFRKSCANEFDSDECKRIRQSIMLGFGIEDGCFTKLLDRLEAAHKREIEDAIAATVKAAAKSVSEVYEPHIQSEPVSNAAKMREALLKSRKATDKQMLNNEDLRWLELIKQVVDGLQAQAEIQAEDCDLEWMAMQYSLESLSETLKSCIDDYKERLGVVDGKNH